VTLGNLIVQIYNGSDGGTFTLRLPDGSSQTTSSTSYTYPNSFTLTTGASGGVSSTVSVTDNETGSVGSCLLSIPGTGTGTSGVVSVAVSPSTSIVKGTAVTLTATASTVTSPVFSFTQSSTYPSYVTISSTSNGVATVTSSVAQTVTVTTTMVSNSSGAATASTTTTLTFTETGSSGGVSVALSASSASATVGTNITVTATPSGISDPVYHYFFGTNTIGANGSFSGPVATLTATAPGSITLSVTVYSSSNSSISATNSITLTFTGGSTGTALSCTLTPQTGTFYRNSSVFFFITSNTNEALKLVYWDAGEPWDGYPPTFPIYLPQSSNYSYFSAAYSYTGTKVVRVLVESASRPGVFCNGGAYLTTSVTIN